MGDNRNVGNNGELWYISWNYGKMHKLVKQYYGRAWEQWEKQGIMGENGIMGKQGTMGENGIMGKNGEL